MVLFFRVCGLQMTWPLPFALWNSFYPAAAARGSFRQLCLNKRNACIYIVTGLITILIKIMLKIHYDYVSSWHFARHTCF